MGPPPPFPGACPDLIASAYFCSIASAVAQLTWPDVTSMWIGTFAAVLVVPQAVSFGLVLAGALLQPTAAASSRVISTMWPDWARQDALTSFARPPVCMGSPFLRLIIMPLAAGVSSANTPTYGGTAPNHLHSQT